MTERGQFEGPESGLRIGIKAKFRLVEAGGGRGDPAALFWKKPPIRTTCSLVVIIVARFDPF